MENNKNIASKSSKDSAKSKSNDKSSMQSSQLMKLFEDQLKDINWAENALIKALPKMMKNASSEELNEALSKHLDETKEHVSRLEKVFKLIDVKVASKKCDAMDGLIDEASDIMESCEQGPMRDAGIISAAQKVEHYEIATYGTLRQFAETLELTEVVDLLGKTLKEENAADQKLTKIAKKTINTKAALENV